MGSSEGSRIVSEQGLFTLPTSGSLAINHFDVLWVDEALGTLGCIDSVEANVGGADVEGVAVEDLGGVGHDGGVIKRPYERWTEEREDDDESRASRVREPRLLACIRDCRALSFEGHMRRMNDSRREISGSLPYGPCLKLRTAISHANGSWAGGV